MILAVLAGVHRLVHVSADDDRAGAGVDDDVRPRAAGCPVGGARRGAPKRRDQAPTDRGERGHRSPRARDRGEAAGSAAHRAPRLGASAAEIGSGGRGRPETARGPGVDVPPWGRGPVGRISARIAAITESATLAVDAKAKALKAAGENVIGFGAGRARLPDARRTSSRPRSRPAATPRTTTTRRRRACPSCARRSRTRPSATPASTCAAAQVLVTNGGKHAVYNTFQALLRPGRRGAAARAVLDDVPRGDHARAAACRSCCRPTEADGLPGHGRPARSRGARRARRRCCSCRRATRPARCTRPTRSRRSAAGRVEHGIWVVTDEIYEHLTYDGHVFSSMPALVPELADTLRHPQRRRQDLRDDRLARRLDDRPARRDHGRDQPAVALHVERRRTSRSAPRSRRSAATSTRSPRCATRSTRRGQHDARAARRRSPASRASSRRARSTASRRSRACSAARSRGRTPHDDARAVPRCCSRRRRSRSCPARRSARPATPGCRSRSATTTSAKASRRIADFARRSRVPTYPAAMADGSARSRHRSRSPSAASKRMRAAGPRRRRADSGLSPERAARRGQGRAGARDPQRDAGHGRGARGRRPISSSSAGPASGSTTSTSPRPRAAA